MKHSTPQKPSEPGLRTRVGLALLALVLLIAGWEGAARAYPPSILPGPLETLDALAWLLQYDQFYQHIEVTLVRAGTGFAVSMLLGIGGGLLIGRFRYLNSFANPLIAIATTIPPVFWVAIMIIWLGLGSGPPILVIILTATPLVMVNIIQGMQDMPAGLVEMAAVFRVGWRNRLLRLYLPAMSGYLFAAALIATRFTWRVVIMAEFIGSSSGLGNRLAWSRQNLETDMAFAYMLVILVFSLAIEYGLLRPAQAHFTWPALSRRKRKTHAATTRLPWDHSHAA